MFRKRHATEAPIGKANGFPYEFADGFRLTALLPIFNHLEGEKTAYLAAFSGPGADRVVQASAGQLLLWLS
jgi:hypothetical protein